MSLNSFVTPCWSRPHLLSAVCPAVAAVSPCVGSSPQCYSCLIHQPLFVSFDVIICWIKYGRKKKFALLVHNIYFSYGGLISGQPVQLCWFQVCPPCKQQALLRLVKYWWALRPPAPLAGRPLNYETVACVCVDLSNNMILFWSHHFASCCSSVMNSIAGNPHTALMNNISKWFYAWNNLPPPPGKGFLPLVSDTVPIFLILFMDLT